jgi:PAS domain-containing protein
MNRLEELAVRLDDFAQRASYIEMAVNSTTIGVWRWDLDTGVVSWDENMLHIFGHDKTELTYEDFESFIASKSDRELVAKLCRKAIETESTYEALFDINHRHT